MLFIAAQNREAAQQLARDLDVVSTYQIIDGKPAEPIVNSTILVHDSATWIPNWEEIKKDLYRGKNTMYDIFQHRR